MKYQRFAQLMGKNIGVRQFGFVAKTPFHNQKNVYPGENYFLQIMAKGKK